MYIPKHFEKTDIDTLQELMRSHPLATLVTLGSGGLHANHIPLHLASGSSEFGVLRGHVARANPIRTDIDSEVEALAIFQGPQTYISPSWYASKRETGKVVPTWNYAVVHAYGKLNAIEDPAWIRRQMEALTQQQEAGFNVPWKVADAPHDYIEKQIGAVVGIEIVITNLRGKWKTSQNQPAQNQRSVIDKLASADDPESVRMAELIRKNSLA